MTNDIDARSGAIDPARRSAMRRSRRAPQVVSIGLLVMATVAGVHLGSDGPEVSPVSPAAIAARYGTPPIGPPAMPPAAAAATLPAETPATPSADVAAAPSGEVSALPPIAATTVPATDAAAASRGGVAALPAEGAAQPSVEEMLQHEHQRGGRDGGKHD